MRDHIIIADSSCLIGLSNIQRLHLLEKLYDSISITPEVQLEFNESIPDWINVVPISDFQKRALLELELDKGEASAIVLSLETQNSILIIDEKKGRRIAKSLGVRTMGTLGVLIQAKKAGILAELKPEINNLAKAGFRISESLKNQILHSVGEVV